MNLPNTMRPRLHEGQQELRDNLRAIIADSGRTQSAVCSDAGLVLHHLAGALAGANWMPRERVEALAAALEVSPGELMGASMYKGETWMDARLRRSVADWRRCPKWCRGVCAMGVTNYDRDGRVTRNHHGFPFGSRFALALEYDDETGEEVERTAHLHLDDDRYGCVDLDLADLAIPNAQTEQVARWLRGEVVLP